MIKAPPDGRRDHRNVGLYRFLIPSSLFWSVRKGGRVMLTWCEVTGTWDIQFCIINRRTDEFPSLFCLSHNTSIGLRMLASSLATGPTSQAWQYAAKHLYCHTLLQNYSTLNNIHYHLDLDAFINSFGRLPLGNWSSMSHTALLHICRIKKEETPKYSAPIWRYKINIMYYRRHMYIINITH